MDVSNDLKEDFRLYTLTPEVWLDIAEKLEAAFTLLLKEIEKANIYPFNYTLGNKVTLPFFLLAGYAFEDLFKGICVANKTYTINNDTFSKCSHHLLDLAKDAGFTNLSNDEKWLLQRIEAITVWGGRYPAPTSANKLNDVIRPDGVADSLIGWSNNDIPLFKNLYRKVKLKFIDLLEQKK